VISNDEALYVAFKAKDTRFDGRFFVGIRSTGIYCRPVCRAKLAKPQNCTFFATAAEAEQAGHRPCLLCRPEIAPSSVTDYSANLASRMAKLLEENCANDESLAEIANQLHYGERHLRRVFANEYHISPVKYLQTCRLLLAKSLLTDTNLPVLDVAMTAGFGSVRRFNDLFKAHYRLTPSALRKQTSADKPKNGDITLALGYRPPYHWKEMLNFFAVRAIKGVEVVKDDAYSRTVRLTNTGSADNDTQQTVGRYVIRNNASKNALLLTVSESLLPALPTVLARVKRQFDLSCDPHAVYETLQQMNDLRPDLCKLGTRLPGCFDAFEMAVRAVLGQQITVKAAGTLTARLVADLGTKVATDVDGLTHVFPSPADISALGDSATESLGKLGIIATRSRTIMELAKLFQSNELFTIAYSNPENVIQKLLAIQGIGSWTAQYVAMRVFGWTDAFLETDFGVKKVLTAYSPKEMLRVAEHWRPWRSYAVVNIWNAL
jgi:AraC family transcriptional regulator of adaptative response / DNA-3-methyladenine glycosylase II